MARTSSFKPKFVVKQASPPAEPVPTEIIAQEIEYISAAIAKLRSGKLNDRALFLLIQNACASNVPIKTIREVLDAAQHLSTSYIRKGVL
jgi:hypothetical protein